MLLLGVLFSIVTGFDAICNVKWIYLYWLTNVDGSALSRVYPWVPPSYLGTLPAIESAQLRCLRNVRLIQRELWLYISQANMCVFHSSLSFSFPIHLRQRAPSYPEIFVLNFKLSFPNSPITPTKINVTSHWSRKCVALLLTDQRNCRHEYHSKWLSNVCSWCVHIYQLAYHTRSDKLPSEQMVVACVTWPTVSAI